MTVVYYTNDEGRITRHHMTPDDMNPLELQEKIAEFNKKTPNHQAHARVIEDGSLEAYLLDLANRKVRLSKETVRDALDAIREARCLIEGLADGL